MMRSLSSRFTLTRFLCIFACAASAACSSSDKPTGIPDVDLVSVSDSLLDDSQVLGDSSSRSDSVDLDQTQTDDQKITGDLAQTDQDSVTDTLEPPPSLLAEAGFIDIEPITYTLRHGGKVKELTSSEARIWYIFQPADEDPETKPLAVFFNGGPGSSTSLLFGFNTGRWTVDPRLTGGLPRIENPYSWTRFANLLYIDARQTGFSYNLMDNVQNKSYRNKEFATRNFNPLFDGADFIRVVLRFLSKHQVIQDNPVIIVGESYGGVRGTVMGYLLLNYSEMGEGTILYEDVALAQEIQTHFEAIWPEFAGARVPRETIATQFGHQVFVQPLLSGEYQSEVAGEMFEQPDSLIHQIAEETGTPFVTCAERGQSFSCDAEYNAQIFMDEQASRDLYNVAEPKGWIDDICLIIDQQLVQPASLAELLGSDPMLIPEMYPSARKRGYRYGDLPSDDLMLQLTEAFPKALANAAVPYALRLTAQRRQMLSRALYEPTIELQTAFGQLYEWDEYYVSSQYPVTATFYMFEALIMKIDPSQNLYGEMFLYDIAYQKAFITKAAHDIVIFAPAIPPALCKHTDLVESCEVVQEGEGDRPGFIRFTYKTGAFDGISLPQSVDVRFPDYLNSGHPVEATEPEEFLSDVEEWYGSVSE